jgi:site-specific DNA-cytosine methylase
MKGNKMKVLVACEISGRVRDAFRAKGHDAYSCDLEISQHPFHIIADHDLHIFDIIDEGNWDLIIAHPPCTHLAVSGARWFKDKQQEQYEAIQFFMAFTKTKVQKYCIENPICIMSTKWRKPDQIIQPWQFGHGETKATCLWLRNLKQLQPTNIVEGREARIYKMSPSKDRGKLRSITYQGIADAMAEQWG